MRIKQCYVSRSLHQLWPIKNFYSLEDYSSVDNPTFFVGLYDDRDIKTWNNHRGFKVLLPGYPEHIGGAFTKIDIDKLNLIVYDEAWEYLAKCNKIKKYKLIRLAWQDVSVCKPVPLGDKIYIHFGGHSETEYKHFNKDKWIEIFGDELIYPTEWVDYYDLVENYFSRSYVQIMVSPIPIRGESTAQCLGLMGRKCLSPWPCLTPNYEIYRRWDLKDLFIKVRKERKKIGTIQSELAQQVYDFFDFSDDWLYEDYWK